MMATEAIGEKELNSPLHVPTDFKDLLRPVDISCAEKELVEKSYTYAGFYDAIDPFGKRAEQFPELSNSSQITLVAAYQQCRNISALLTEDILTNEEKILAKRILKREDLLTGYILGSVFRLVRVVVQERATRRYGYDKAKEILPDLLQDAAVTVLKAASDYDAAKNVPFASWAADRLRREIPACLLSHGALGSMPANWERVARYVHYKVPELRELLKREPSLDEIRDGVYIEARKWAEGKLTDEQLLLSKKEQEEIIRLKMQSGGITKVLRDELAELMRTVRSEISLDKSYEGSDATLKENLALFVEEANETVITEEEDFKKSLFEVSLSGLSREEKEGLLACWGFVDGKKWSYKKAGEVYHVADLQLKRAARRAESRLGAPHAHFAYLAADSLVNIIETIEITEKEVTSEILQQAKSRKESREERSKAATVLLEALKNS